MPVELRLAEPAGKIQVVGQAPGILSKGSKAQGAFFVELATDQLQGRKTPLVIDVWSNGQKIDQIKTNFMGPGGRKKQEQHN